MFQWRSNRGSGELSSVSALAVSHNIRDFHFVIPVWAAIAIAPLAVWFLVVGHANSIGQQDAEIARKLAVQNHKVAGLVRGGSAHPKAKQLLSAEIEIIAGDLCSPETSPIQGVCHCHIQPPLSQPRDATKARSN